MTDTAPMPLAAVRRPALIGRFTVALAGLLAAGALILGIGLLIAMLVLPAPGTTAVDGTTGPGWPRTVAHLVIGILAELGGQWARRGRWPVRVAVAAVTVVAVLTVLALSWWR